MHSPIFLIFLSFVRWVLCAVLFSACVYECKLRMPLRFVPTIFLVFVLFFFFLLLVNGMQFVACVLRCNHRIGHRWMYRSCLKKFVSAKTVKQKQEEKKKWNPEWYSTGDWIVVRFYLHTLRCMCWLLLGCVFFLLALVQSDSMAISRAHAAQHTRSRWKEKIKLKLFLDDSSVDSGSISPVLASCLYSTHTVYGAHANIMYERARVQCAIKPCLFTVFASIFFILISHVLCVFAAAVVDSINSNLARMAKCGISIIVAQMLIYFDFLQMRTENTQNYEILFQKWFVCCERRRRRWRSCYMLLLCNVLTVHSAQYD